MKLHTNPTPGFSGADIAELCQRAAKAAIRDAIASDELKQGDDAAMDDLDDGIILLIAIILLCSFHTLTCQHVVGY